MNNLALVGIRLVAIYMMVTGINAVVGIGSAMQMMQAAPEDTPFLIVQTAGIALPLLGGIVLWLFARRLARLISRDTNPAKDIICEHELVAAGTFLIGLYLAFSSIPPLYASVSHYFALDYGWDSSSTVETIKRWSLHLGLGLVLMLGHRFFVRAYYFLRRAGTGA